MPLKADDERVVLTHRVSAIEIDVEDINKSLATVNNFSKRQKVDKLPKILMYEITSDGESTYKYMTLRELLLYVNEEALEIDNSFYTNPTRNKDAIQKEKSELKDGKDQTVPNHTAQSSRSNHTGLNNTSKKFGMDELHHDASYGTVSSLRLRDLRRLDFQFNPYEEKSILIRRHAILFAMDPIRAVVMANRLILIVPDGADSLLSILDQYMKEWHTSQQQLHPPKNSAETAADSTISVPSSSSHSHLQLTLPNHNQPTHKSSNHSVEHIDMHHLHVASPTNNTNTIDNPLAISFEIHAYEALLTTVKELATQEFQSLQKQIEKTLSFTRNSNSSLLPLKLQEEMRTMKNDLSVMNNRVQNSRNVLQTLTEDDEEMCLMNLTILKLSPTLYKFPLIPEILSKHDEIEELLESYLIDFNSLESKIEYLRNQIQSAQELVLLRLDTSRNELLIANTALAVLACSIAFGGYIAGIFGMNLDNTIYLQPMDNSFVIVTVCSFGLIVIIFFLIMHYFSWSGIFPRRLSMQGTSSGTGSSGGHLLTGTFSYRSIFTSPSIKL